jgi:hypothetical protein
MKRFGLLALMSVLVLGLAIYFVSCGDGGGGTAGGGGNPPVNYTSPSQAASSSQAVTAAIALSSAVGSAADLAGSQIPAGYAPSFRAKAVDTSSVGNIDSRLKTAVDKMIADLKKPIITGALAKTSALKTANLAPFLASSITASTSCAGGGYYAISGSDTSTISYTEKAITVTYYNCRDTALSSYDIVSGSLQAYHKHMLDGSSDIKNVTTTSLSITSYLTPTMYFTDTLNGTFDNSLTVAGNVTSGQSAVNGSIQEISYFDSTVINATVGFNNISDVWSSITTTSSGTVTTEEHTSNGSITFDISSGGSAFTFVLSLSQLADKVRTNADLSEDEWINGSISMNWSPNPDASACLPGTLTISTVADTPIHTPTYGSCPTSGTITLNNATIQFGVPTGTVGVLVTVGTSSVSLSDCYSLGGSACIAGGSSQVSQPTPL